MVMIVAPKAESTDLVILDESIFLSRDNEHLGKRIHSIDLGRDSYIIVYTGRRGGGKTTCMSWMAVKAVVLYNMRLVSNFPLEFMLRRHKPDGSSYLQHVKAEPLDFYKLMTFDEIYHDCCILIDESPDVINYMSSQSWKNRLFEAFVRQIRKNKNTLMLCAQDFGLIDKSARWQTDIRVECKDMARFYGSSACMERGEEIFTEWYDLSGLWTGRSADERMYHGMRPSVKRIKIFPRVLWGDKEAGTKPVYDTFFTIDILDSLRKVDLQLTKTIITDKQEQTIPDGVREPLCQQLEIGLKQGKMKMTELYAGVGDIDQKLKTFIGHYLSTCGIRRYAGGWFDFSNFDMEKFRSASGI